MAAVVQIEVTLDEKGAVQGFRQIGTEGGKLEGGLQRVGQRGNLVFTSLAKQQKQAHEAGQLLNNTLGVQMPRALENVLAKLPGLGTLLAGAFKASVVLAVLGVVADLIPKIQEAADTMGGFTKEMKDFNEEASKSNQQLFINPKTLEDTRLHLAQVNQEIDRRAHVNSLLRQQTYFEAVIFQNGEEIRKNEEATIGLRKQQVSLTEDLTKKTEALQQRTTALFGQAGSAGLTGAAAIRQNMITELAKIDEEFKNARPGSAEAELGENSRIIAHLKANREIAALDRQHADETRSLLNASLLLEFRGRDAVVEKYRQTIQAIDILEKRGELGHIDAEQRRIAAGAVENDALVKLEYSKQDRIRAAENSARSENLKGIAAIVEAEREQIDEIRVLRERGEIDDEEFSKREVEINKRTKKQIIESERQTAQTLRQFHEDTVQAQERAAVAALPEWKRANAQITVDAQDRIRQIDEAEKELLRNVAANSDEYERITRDAQARRAAVWAETNARIADEHKNMVNQLADQLGSWLDDITGGNFLKRLESEFKKMMLRMVAAWLLGLGQMKSGAQGGTGGILGGIFGGIFGGGQGGGGILGGIFGGGGTPGQPANGGTPPFIGNILGSSGGGASGAVTGSGVNHDFISSLGLGGASASTGGSSSKFGGILGAGTIGGGGLSAALQKLGLSKQAAGNLAGVLGIAGAGFAGFSLGYGSASKLTGSLGGAAMGALAGLTFGPVGVAVGAIVGALAGLFGGLFGGAANKRKANAFVDNTLTPSAKQIEDGYKNFQIDYETAVKDLEDLKTQSYQQLHQYHSQGDKVFTSRAWAVIADTEARIKDIENERQRRGAVQFSPPQFHDGGLVDGPRIMGWRLGSGEVPATLRRGEFVMNEGATRRNLPHLERMNKGGHHGGGGDRHVNIYPRHVDEKWLRNGGAKQIHDELNKLELEGVA